MSDRGVDGATLCLCVIMVQAMVLAVASMVLAVLLCVIMVQCRQ